MGCGGKPRDGVACLAKVEHTPGHRGPPSYVKRPSKERERGREGRG